MLCTTVSKITPKKIKAFDASMYVEPQSTCMPRGRAETKLTMVACIVKGQPVVPI
eukprot:CAMPEP_0183448022 /NCGR_PEP_ID=MMETSP0370-20130417/104831_1 /TAXON_ID=268820 /ORGANISM="Peridinium aciculiferum, Strain PAER-2" /LENGTH=54 /DNA_ID=CAMNT_0025638931 /DNA_START=19 /DNA_END=180 /DNA_ORIENTATION=+